MTSTKNVRKWYDIEKCDLKICSAWCCKQFWIILPEGPDQDMKKYLELHGVKVNGKRLTILLRCGALMGNACSIYLDRPEFCRKFWCKDPKNNELM